MKQIYVLLISDYLIIIIQKEITCSKDAELAPELLDDKIYDFKIDSFSAGVIMFIILTVKAPFKEKKNKDIISKN